MQPELLKSKKAKVAGVIDMGLVGLIMADKLDPEIGAICIAAITAIYIIAQALSDMSKDEAKE